ncbi:MAG: S8 family peptidase [Myxococcales bacterium]
MFSAVGTVTASGPGAAPDASKPASARLIVKLKPELSERIEASLPQRTLRLESRDARDSAVAAFLQRHRGVVLSPVFKDLVSLKKQRNLPADRVSDLVREKFPRRAARRDLGARPPDVTRTYVLELDRAAAVPETLARLRRDPAVEYAEADAVVAVALTPDDPYFGTTGSWGQAFDDLWGLKRINAATAWDTTHGQGVVVAVVDTGLDFNHPDIAANAWVNADEIAGNGLDDDGNGYVDDVRGWDFIGASYQSPGSDNNPEDGNGHGTHVAGTVAAAGNNAVGVVGVAWGARVMVAKGLDASGRGLASGLANAILYAANNGADVVNNSWGGEGTSQTVAEAIDYANSLGVVTLAAAGNAGAEVRGYFPASFSNVITVASTRNDDSVYYSSNHGSRIDVAAPGVDILSLRASGTSLGTPLDALYTRATGTSMACPHAAGLAALLLAHHPDYSVEQVRQALRSTAAEAGFYTGYDLTSGFGRIDAAAALAAPAVLESKVLSPADGAHVSAPTVLSGVAQGAAFSHFTLEYAAGTEPYNNWTVFSQGVSAVDHAPLAGFDPATLADGIYTIRLTTYDTAGRAFVDRMQLVVDYVSVTSPPPPRVPNLSVVHKAGLPLSVVGTATGPSLSSYQVAWAPGVNPASGWSSQDVTLPGGGLSPVVGGLLATWATPASLAAGHYTLRVRVQNAGFFSETFTLVYLEPDLLSPAWPQWLDNAPSSKSGFVPATASGATTLTLVSPPRIGCLGPSKFRRFAPDGTLVQGTVLDYGAMAQQAASDVDGLPGDEVIVGESNHLRVFRADGSSTVLAPSVNSNFQSSAVLVEDLESDGVQEILALGTVVSGSGSKLFAWHADGALVGGQFPISVSNSNSALSMTNANRVLAADLGYSPGKEIVVVEGLSSTTSTLRLFAADGAPLTWSVPTFSGYVAQVAVGRFDGDSTPSVVVLTAGSSAANQVHVLGADGAERPGSPVSMASLGTSFALVDLDRDGRDENRRVRLQPPLRVEGRRDARLRRLASRRVLQQLARRRHRRGHRRRRLPGDPGDAARVDLRRGPRPPPEPLARPEPPGGPLELRRVAHGRRPGRAPGAGHPAVHHLLPEQLHRESARLAARQHARPVLEPSGDERPAARRLRGERLGRGLQPGRPDRSRRRLHDLRGGRHQRDPRVWGGDRAHDGRALLADAGRLAASLPFSRQPRRPSRSVGHRGAVGGDHRAGGRRGRHGRRGRVRRRHGRRRGRGGAVLRRRGGLGGRGHDRALLDRVGQPRRDRRAAHADRGGSRRRRELVLRFHRRGLAQRPDAPCHRHHRTGGGSDGLGSRLRRRQRLGRHGGRGGAVLRRRGGLGGRRHGRTLLGHLGQPRRRQRAAHAQRGGARRGRQYELRLRRGGRVQRPDATVGLHRLARPRRELARGRSGHDRRLRRQRSGLGRAVGRRGLVRL